MTNALSLATVESFVPMMQERGVSEVARSSRGFIQAYRRAGSVARMDPEWQTKRENFIKRHMAQVKMRGEPLFEDDGAPTRRHLALIAWAYSPQPNRLKRMKNTNPEFDYPTYQKVIKRALRLLPEVIESDDVRGYADEAIRNTKTAALKARELANETGATMDGAARKLIAFVTTRTNPAASNTKANIVKIFNEIIDSAPAGSFPRPVSLVIDEKTALAGRDPNGRGHACSTVGRRDTGTVHIAPKLVWADRKTQYGVLMHELAHVSFLQRGNFDHTEREADALCEELWLTKIYYDEADVQTTNSRGVSPRPAHLDAD